MACTTILAGKKATYDGSTMIARNDDSGGGHFTAKKFVVVRPEDQPRNYRSVLSHAEIELPENPMRYTAVPNALEGEGIWAAGGINEENIAMTATETITSNARVLGADPLIKYIPAEKGLSETKGGIGEEDLVVLVLPYIHSAREGVTRLGGLLQKYGTWEMNGIAFQDVNEIWWLETIGGHHWIARKVPDDSYVVMPNQFGMDAFDLDDAFGSRKNTMCSEDLREFIQENHLDLSLNGIFNARTAFGSCDDADHVYNTPRAWYTERFLNPHSNTWDGPDADFRPDSDDIPWCRVPEKKITPEDIKYILSSHFQRTPYDPYSSCGDSSRKGAYRSIGVNRTSFMALFQIRPDLPDSFRSVEWLSFGSNVFNASVPLYVNINTVPEYLSNTGKEVSTDNFYWSNRLIGALADSRYAACLAHIERYQYAVAIKGHELIGKYDKELAAAAEGEDSTRLCERANQEITDMLKAQTQSVLDQVLFEASSGMKNAYARSDA